MPATILPSNQAAHAAELLRTGALVAFPTDTVYGVAAVVDGCALGSNPDSSALRAFKGGRAEHFSLHVSDAEDALRWLGARQPAEEFALRTLTPRGVTVVLRHKDRGLGVRAVGHELGSEFIAAAGVPVLATSANLHGTPPLSDPMQIAALPGVDAVLDGGVLPARPASTVVRLLPLGLQLLRQGALQRTELERLYTRSVQFVCLGNLNRSAFAHRWVEAVQHWLAVHVPGFVPAWRVRSSGVVASAGQSVPEPMIAAAHAWGANLAGHTPSRFNPADAEDDLLAAMGDDVRLPRNGIRFSVSDPMGGPMTAYARAAAQAAGAVRAALFSAWAPLQDAPLEQEFEKLFSGPGA